MTNDIITIKHHYYGETTVKVVREYPKAVRLAGNASEVNIPKSAIDSDGYVADWIMQGLDVQFLWQAPYTEAA